MSAAIGPAPVISVDHGVTAAAPRTVAWRPLARANPIPVAAVLFLLGGLALWSVGASTLSRTVLMGGLLVTGGPLVWRTLTDVARGRWATDVVAVLAILASVALQQSVAGLVIVLMQSGGEALERFAAGRASAAVKALEDAAPRVAHRLDGGEIVDLRVDDVAVGDLLLVRPGELVPCDSEVVGGRSHVDVSRLTGEPIPVTVEQGSRLMSGSANGEGTLTVKALATAASSQYAKIVTLVRQAQASKAPLQRLADRYAVWFTPITVALCALTYAVTRDPMRVLAVLVVATPCPLILATPIAIIGGINRAARHQIIVRNGIALERLEGLTIALFDKTGTITVGEPRVRQVHTAPGVERRDLLRLAGGLEQASGHLLARTLVQSALESGISLPTARAVIETAGRGVTGVVDGRQVSVGSRAFLLHCCPSLAGERALEPRPGLRAHVAIDGCYAGSVEYADEVRPEARDALRRLAHLGVRRTMMLSGDHAPAARAVAAIAGISEVAADLTAEGKVDIVRNLVSSGEQVLMVGDGTNDAPALASATVGVAMAGKGGGGVTAEAAGVVVLAEDLRRVPDAVRIATRAMTVARQSIWCGLGLSALAMGVAALGYLRPVTGAVLQEMIDVAVIFNALRAGR